MEQRFEQSHYSHLEERLFNPQQGLVKHPEAIPVPADEYTSKRQQQAGTTVFRAREVEYHPSSKKIVQYELAFDQQKAQELHQVKLYEPERYAEEREAFEGFIMMQLLTALGERYNRGISEFSYRIKDGKLVGEHSDEPFEDVLIRGRDYRKEHGDPLDHPRETAEVIGFQKMQEVMTSEQTPSGTVMLTISPPGGEGSIYKHNFYDGYRKNDDGSIQAIRFSSALTPEETIMRLREIDPQIKTPQDSSAVTLLSNPILLDKKLTLDEIHQRLHKDHDILREDEWEKVKEVGEILGTSYIATWIHNPDNDQRPKEIFNALLNQADDVVDALKNSTYDQKFGIKRGRQLSEDEFYTLAYRPVRVVDTGCGLSGGSEMGGGLMGSSSALGAFGVSAFGAEVNMEGLCGSCPGSEPHFHCPGKKTVKEKDEDGNEVKREVACTYKVIYGKGTTLCPECGEMKKC